MNNTILIAVGSWVGGILAAVIVQQILNRRRVLSYFVQHFSVGTSAEDQTFGSVKVTWNDSPVTNLYLSTVELRNESAKDLESIRVKAISLNSALLTEFPQMVGTSEFVKYAPDFERELTVAPGEQASDRQLATYRQRREYLIPVMNRGQLIRFQYLNTSAGEQPNIILETIHPGVVLKYKLPQPSVYGVPVPWAALAGGLAGLLFAAILYAYSPYLWLTAFGCLFFGFFAQVPGAYIVRAIRAVRQWLSG